MEQQISFKISYKKAIEALVWLANAQPGIDIYHVAKVLFFADKVHINRYGRPILGDTYVKLPYGPVPSGVRDLITKNSWLSPRQLESVVDSLKIDENENFRLTAQREPDMNYFSKSDLKCLQASLDEYGMLSFDELYERTHAEKCYILSNDKDKIDYSLFIDDDNPVKKEIIEGMHEASSYLQV